MRRNYVVGFAFSSDKSQVVLIRKNRPAWQAGKLNGVGGKFEDGEDGLACMVREFHEETGVMTTADDWHYFTKIIGRDGDVLLYRLFDDKVLAARSTSDEPVEIIPVDFVHIRAEGLSPANGYVGSVTLNGKPLQRSFLRHEEIMAGGELLFRMQAAPNKEWGRERSARPYSQTAYQP